MVKKIDWKYTIVKQFFKDIQDPYSKFVSKLTELFKESNKDSKVELSYMRYNEYLEEAIKLVDSEKDAKQLLEFINFLDKENLIHEPSTTGSLYSSLQKLYFMRDILKDEKNILSIKKIITEYKGIDILNEADDYELLDKTLTTFNKPSEIFSDINKYDKEIKILFNSFKSYDILDGMLKNTLLSNIIKGNFKKGKVLFYDYNIDKGLEVKTHGNFKFDDKELIKLSDEINEIYKSYHYLLEQLKEKTVKQFSEFIEEELPKLKLETYETNINDMISDDYIKNKSGDVYNGLVSLDTMVERLKLV